MTIAGSTSSARADLPVWLRIGLLSFGGPAGQIALIIEKIELDERQCVRIGRAQRNAAPGMWPQQHRHHVGDLPPQRVP